MNNEIWKDIKGYEGLYQVSNLGNVRSLDRFVYDFNSSSKNKRFKKGKKNVNRFAPPSIEFENEYYNEIFHSGNSKETSDDEMIRLVEMIRERY